MKRVEFLGKLQMIYAGDRNAFNDIVGEYDRLKENYERIYNENCKLREQHNINDISLLDENNRLKNIIDELEKDINNQIMMTRKLDKYNEGFFNATLHFYNKLKALKEENK